MTRMPVPTPRKLTIIGALLLTVSSRTRRQQAQAGEGQVTSQGLRSKTEEPGEEFIKTNASERNNGVLVALQRMLDILELMTRHLPSEQSNRKKTIHAAEYDFWSEVKEADEVHYTVESFTCKQVNISKYMLVMGGHCTSERSIRTAL